MNKYNLTLTEYKTNPFNSIYNGKFPIPPSIQRNFLKKEGNNWSVEKDKIFNYISHLATDALENTFAIFRNFDFSNINPELQFMKDLKIILYQTIEYMIINFDYLQLNKAMSFSQDLLMLLLNRIVEIAILTYLV